MLILIGYCTTHVDSSSRALRTGRPINSIVTVVAWNAIISCNIMNTLAKGSSSIA